MLVSISVGVGFAVVAMLCWGIGDFLIQKSTRKLGDWETLFVITAFGTIVLFPFVYKDIPRLFTNPDSGLWILVTSGILLLGASLLDFEGFKKGKLSVLEPILSFEIPAAAFLAYLVLGDQISWIQIVVIVVLMVGLFMISFREKRFSKTFFLEKGVILFFLGAILMGTADFLLGWGSRIEDPLLANFVLSFVIAAVSFVFLVLRGQLIQTLRDVRRYPALVLVMSIVDNVAWVAYAFAMTLVPIAIATGLSESSIIIAVILGFVINKERMQRHQKIGLLIAITAAFILAFSTT